MPKMLIEIDTDTQVVVPRVPTVSNAMKYKFMGEFEWAACDAQFDEDGNVIEQEIKRTVPWDLFKAIYKQMAAHWVSEQQQSAQPAPVPTGERTASINLTIAEIKDLAEFAGFTVKISDSDWCDGEAEFVVEEGTLPCCDDDGSVEYYRHRMYMVEYPEEGCIPLGTAIDGLRKPADTEGGAE